MDAIIPAAGLASRMRGIPKFLLPCDATYNTLIEVHISALLEICETVWIPTRPEMVLLLDSLGIAKDRVVILPMTTDNMTQTVTKVLQIAKSKYFQLVMPDTFFHGEKPYATLKDKPELVDLACWSIREEQKGKLGQVLIEENKVIDIRDKDKNCDYAYSWGALTFNRELLNYSTAQDPHIGFAVKSALDSGEDITSRIMHGKYFDCGTPSEYLEMLEKVI